MGHPRIHPGLFFAVTASLFASSCGDPPSNSSSDSLQVALQLGEVMASIDELGGTGGTLGSMEPYLQKLDERLSKKPFLPELIPSAHAAVCTQAGTFQACTPLNRTTIRDFSGCTIGSSTLKGTITLTWSGSGTGCQLGTPVADTSAITRKPKFTITSSSGSVYSVDLAPGATYGQKAVYSSGSGSTAVYRFSTDGIRCTLVDSSGISRAELTMTTVSVLIITGSSRVPRVLSGGTIRIRNNVNDVTCDFTPSNVTWSGTCNCPVSGSWTATCSSGPAVALTLGGCGTAVLNTGGLNQNVTFDRCYGI